MTGIKSAIDFFTRYKGCQYEIDPNECCHRECSECDYNYDVRTAKKYIETAIRSLQAWEEVMTELEEAKADVTELNIEYYLGELAGLKTATDIINQKLAEIEE